MKQFLYFLLGLSIILFPFRYLYAAVLNTDCLTTKFSASYTVHGYYMSDAEAQAACTAYKGSPCGISSLSLVNGNNCQVPSASGNLSIQFRDHLAGTYHIFVIIPSGSTIYNPDSDGDGIPNDCDLYPTQNIDYTAKVLAFQTNDGTSSGTITWMSFLTDLGDMKEAGTYVANETTQKYIWSASHSSADICSLLNSNTVVSPNSPSNPYGETTPISDIPPVPDPAVSGTGLAPGIPKTGTETDSEALKDIKQNTSATADNTKRLGDYLADINQNLKRLNNSTVSNSQINNETNTYIRNGLTGDSGESITKSDVTDAIKDSRSLTSTESSALSGAIGDLSDSIVYDPQQLSDIKTDMTTEPTKEDLPDNTDFYGDSEHTVGIADGKFNLQNMVLNLIDDNPITDVLEGVDVNTSGNCQFTYAGTLPSGTPFSIDFTVCAFESALESFGSILLSLVSIGSFLMIIRR